MPNGRMNDWNGQHEKKIWNETVELEATYSFLNKFMVIAAKECICLSKYGMI